jgi:hypothetical protein
MTERNVQGGLEIRSERDLGFSGGIEMTENWTLTRRRLLGLVPAAGYAALSNRLGFADTEPVIARIDAAPQAHPLVPALRMAHECQQALAEVDDYTAILEKKEMVGSDLLESRMHLKLRHEPFGVYLKFIEPAEGRQVLFVPGENDDQLLVRETGLAGLVGAISLDPEGSMAMEENRHPITRIGLKFLLDAVIENWLDQTAVEGATVNYYPNARISGVACKAIEVAFAEEHALVEFQKRRLYIDAESNLPIRVENFGFPARQGGNSPLLEDYLYSNLRTNVGLTDADFDPENDEYGF